MGPTKSARDTPASGGQAGTLSHDNVVHNVNQPTSVVSESAPNSNLGAAQDVNQAVSSQNISALSNKKSKTKWRRYRPGFKVTAVRLTRATASDGTRVGLRRAAIVLGIRHDAIVVWQRHYDDIREQAINLNENVEDDLSELIYRSAQVGASGVGGKRNIPKEKEALLAQMVIEKQVFTVEGIVRLAREVWPGFMPNPSPDAPSKNHALWYNRASTWVSRFAVRHNINRRAFDNTALMGSQGADNTVEPESAGVGLSSHMMLPTGYQNVPGVQATTASGATNSQT
eukprot:488985_1